MKPTKETPSRRKAQPPRQAGKLCPAPGGHPVCSPSCWGSSVLEPIVGRGAGRMQMSLGWRLEKVGVPLQCWVTLLFLTRTEGPQMLASGWGLHAGRLWRGSTLPCCFSKEPRAHRYPTFLIQIPFLWTSNRTTGPSSEQSLRHFQPCPVVITICGNGSVYI